MPSDSRQGGILQAGDTVTIQKDRRDQDVPGFAIAVVIDSRRQEIGGLLTDIPARTGNLRDDGCRHDGSLAIAGSESRGFDFRQRE